MRYLFSGYFLSILLLVASDGFCQSFGPGLAGRVPSKWITIRGIAAPGMQFKTADTEAKKFTYQEVYARIWLPVIIHSKFSLLIGPHIRAEQYSIHSSGNNPINQFSNFKLRGFGADLKSIVNLGSNSWLFVGANINRSGNLQSLPKSELPYNINVTGVYIKQVSEKKEWGVGLLVSSRSNLAILPVLAYNYNLSPKDILKVSAEAYARAFYSYDINMKPDVYRRIDLDMGFRYNRKLNSLVGVEVFAGYRKNLRNTPPEGIIPVTSSNVVGHATLYIMSPFGSKKMINPDQNAVQ